MIIRIITELLGDFSPFQRFLTFTILITAVVIAFYGINKLLKDRRRYGIVAFILSVVFPGSGFAYNASYVKAWLFVILHSYTWYLGLVEANETAKNAFVIIWIIHIIWSTGSAHEASAKLRTKKFKNLQKSVENNYLQGLNLYIKSGYHVAVDTNFLMHFENVLLDIYKNTNVHLFLHPTVFGELEGLKGSKFREVRRNAQRGFDILELFQKSDRMQWTRRQKHGQNFNSADQRIITGVLTEIQHGVRLVFASHDKGARILARSLNIPVVDPLENYSQRKNIKATS